jgi:hypothetical protein
MVINDASVLSEVSFSNNDVTREKKSEWIEAAHRLWRHLLKFQ